MLNNICEFARLTLLSDELHQACVWAEDDEEEGGRGGSRSGGRGAGRRMQRRSSPALAKTTLAGKISPGASSRVCSRQPRDHSWLDCLPPWQTSNYLMAASTPLPSRVRSFRCNDDSLPPTHTEEEVPRNSIRRQNTIILLRWDGKRRRGAQNMFVESGMTSGKQS